MITKLLFTLGVIGIVWLVLRNRTRPRRLASSEPTARLAGSPRREGNRSPRLAAYGLIFFMILASGVVLYLQWRDEYRIVTVQVINTQTGDVVSYQARRGDVEGRRFQTLDGRVVNVAEIERIEMGARVR